MRLPLLPKAPPIARKVRSVSSLHKRRRASQPELGTEPAEPSATPIPGVHDTQTGAEYARRRIEEELSRCAVAGGGDLGDVPRFSEGELRRGPVLGVGGFGIVREIAGVTLEWEGGSAGSEDRDRGGDFGSESRAFIAEHCICEGRDARYAVKRLKDEVRADPALFARGLMDMAIETRFLAAIEHPNMIKMHAFSSGDPFAPDYFIVLDRLYDTLEVRIGKWARQQRKSQRSLVAKAKKKKTEETQNKLLEDRLTVAFDLSAALKYLHSLNIIYRDIKPENIGFDVKGDVKLFDFGLAKEFVPEGRASDGTYSLTGGAGSPRYMAPEVALHRPYGPGADVYSFSVLLWEIMALSVPYAGYDIELHTKLVVMRGVRPPVDQSWPSSLKLLLQRSWSEELRERPPMFSVTKILGRELARMRGGDHTGLEHYSRRSTFVLRGRRSERGGVSSSKGSNLSGTI